jgi:hypothetical protein
MSGEVVMAKAPDSTRCRGRHTLSPGHHSAGTGDQQETTEMEQEYGSFARDGSELQRPYADQILGARLMGNTVQVQWRQGQHKVGVAMDLRNAMCLLKLLQAIHDDSQEPLPPEPKRVF